MIDKLDNGDTNCPEGLHPLTTDAVEGRPDHRQ
jgi:hypothetical protein